MLGKLDVMGWRRKGNFDGKGKENDQGKSGGKEYRLVGKMRGGLSGQKV